MALVMIVVLHTVVTSDAQIVTKQYQSHMGMCMCHSVLHGYIPGSLPTQYPGVAKSMAMPLHNE